MLAKMHTLVIRVTLVAALTMLLLVALASLGAVGSASGKPSPGGNQYAETRPGWGCGDDNHVHTGPPGRSQYGQYSEPAMPPPGCTQYRPAG